MPKLAPNEFEIELSGIGPLRGVVTPETVNKIESQIGSILALAQMGLRKSLGLGFVTTIIQAFCDPVVGKAMPKRDELELAIMDTGIAEVNLLLDRPLSYCVAGKSAFDEPSGGASVPVETTAPDSRLN